MTLVLSVLSVLALWLTPLVREQAPLATFLVARAQPNVHQQTPILTCPYVGGCAAYADYATGHIMIDPVAVQDALGGRFGVTDTQIAIACMAAHEQAHLDLIGTGVTWQQSERLALAEEHACQVDYGASGDLTRLTRERMLALMNPHTSAGAEAEQYVNEEED